MAWLPGWAKRVKLTIDQNDIDAALSNFPVLVHLSTASGRNSDDVSCVFDELENDANRKKIAVTTSDGETQCYAEIEKWDDANEQAWLWVKVPSVASGADTDLYLYYDKTQADNDTYVGDPSDAVVHNVWDTNYKLVTHMRDDPDTTHVRDSTVNANDGTKRAANEPTEVDGQVGRAQNFDGLNDYVNMGDSDSLDVASITVECWLYPDIDPQNDYTGMICKDQAYFVRFRSGGGFAIMMFIDGGWKAFNTNDLDLIPGQQYHIALTYTSGDSRVYKNGSPFQSTESISGDIDPSGYNLLLGSDRSVAGRFYDGAMDEVRISNAARTAAWIKATNESGRDHLLDFGGEELVAAAAYTKFNRGFN